MKIKSLKLVNFKCFDSLELNDLDKNNLVILVGENGTGKSTIFDAFNLAFSFLVNGNWAGYGVSDLLQNGKDEGSMELVINLTEQEKAALNPTADSFALKVTFSRGRSFNAEAPGINEIRKIVGEDRYSREKTESDPNIKNLGIYIHRSPYRYEEVSDINEPNRSQLNIGEDKNRLNSKAQAQSSRWQVVLSHLLQLDRIIKAKYFEINSQNISESVAGLNDASKKFSLLVEDFNSLLESKKFDKIEETTGDKTYFWIKNLATDNKIEFKQLSSGEKEALFLLSDIRRQEPLNSIIAIDEPELHLHYSLQKKIVSRFSSLGVENQVFLSTHSLAVVRSAMSEGNSVVYYFDGSSQCKEIKNRQDFLELYKVLADDLASVLANEIIFFVEGEDAEKDSATYELMFSDPKVHFVPAKNCHLVTSAAWLALHLVAEQSTPQKLFAIVDGDGRDNAERDQKQMSFNNNLFVLPVYSVESLFFDFELWQKIASASGRDGFKEKTADDFKLYVKNELEKEENLTKATDKISGSRQRMRPKVTVKSSDTIKTELTSSLADGTFINSFPMKEFMGQIVSAVFSFGTIEEFKAELIRLMREDSKINTELNEFFKAAKL